uniref:EF-hand domain-containing protein n=1 Tax=Caenorhabditis japonica TaxID=281687 RepID=A0A8R1DJK9_CAEJA
MDDLADCREVFAYFDSKGDERISVQQVGDVLRALGQNPTEAEIHRCIGSFDREARLSFEDFVPIFQSVSKNRFVFYDIRKMCNSLTSSEKHTVEEFVEGLSHFDKEGNGMINVAELRHLLTTLVVIRNK